VETVARRCFVTVVLCVVGGAGCVTVDDSNARWVDELPASDLQPAPYLIRGNDKLQITVFKQETLSGEALVREDGFITVPLVNDVKVVGMTPMAAAQEIKKKLTDTGFIDKPEVAVAVLETRAPTFAVVGQVKQPGSFELQPGTTVLDGIALAGGLDEFADKERIFVIRKRANEPSTSTSAPAEAPAPQTASTSTTVTASTSEAPPAAPAATPAQPSTTSSSSSSTSSSTPPPPRVRFTWQKLSQSTGKALQFHIEDGDVVVVE
jgi:protein involved in polysaccharide export with SLBB domain